mgnify:CR=1 FL=1
MPQFSIIMNVCNGRPYLTAALQSVLAQTLADWELIFYDDASDDGSADVLREYPDARIRCFRSERRVSLAEARELALLEAKGDWIAILDQDDLWHPDKLRRQAACIAADRAGRLALVYTRAVAFSDDGRRWEADLWHRPGELPQGAIAAQLYATGVFIVMSSVVFRRDLALRTLPFPRDLPDITDVYLYGELMTSFEAAAVQEYCTWYRHHPGSTTARRRKRMCEQIIAYLGRNRTRMSEPLYRRRIAVHETLIAWEELRSGDVAAGLRRLLRAGSLPYCFSRPLAWAFRFRLGKPPQLPLQGVS